MKRSERGVKFGQHSKNSPWIRLNGAHIITKRLIESENHVHRPRQLNYWCLCGVWPWLSCAPLNCLYKPLIDEEEDTYKRKKQKDANIQREREHLRETQ
jgi:hypothetical protein